MKKKTLLFILPMCLSFLTGCKAKTYSLRIVNSNSKVGTVNISEGKYKANEVVEIKVDTIDGYVVDYWNDNHGNYIKQGSEFNFTMPSENTVLTVLYTHDEVLVTLREEVTPAKEGCYDFADVVDNQFIGYYVNGTTRYDKREAYYKWGETFALNNMNTLAGVPASLDNFYEENTGETYKSSISATIPQEGLSIVANYTCNLYGMYVCSNISDYLPISLSGSVDISDGCKTYKVKKENEFGRAYVFYVEFNSTEKNVNLTYTPSDSNYEFDYWLDLDTQEHITDEQIKLTNYSYTHRYKIMLKEVK